MKHRCSALAFAVCSLGAGTAAAQEPSSAPAAVPPAAVPPAAVQEASATEAVSDLQSPEQADVRYSAYSLPRGILGLDLGALGSGGGDAYAKVGLTYGFGGGIDASINLAHVGVGLLNVSGGWHFVDTRYFDLGFRAGVWYGRGEWFWTAQGLVESVVTHIDVLNIPLILTASIPFSRWFQLDLGMGYTFAQLYGSGASTLENSPFTDAEFATRQFYLRPVVRFFLTDSTALQFAAKLPAHSEVALKRTSPDLEFSETWSFEGALRSRFAPGVFGNLRLQYGQVADVLFGASVYPSFEFELRW